MSIDTDHVLSLLSEVEMVAEDILCDREQIVNLDRKRNGSREALRALSKETKCADRTKSWVCFGNMFLKMENQSVQKLLSKDMDTLSKEIDDLHNGLKNKVNKLQDLEGKSNLKGFDLKPLSQNELSLINQIQKGNNK